MALHFNLPALLLGSIDYNVKFYINYHFIIIYMPYMRNYFLYYNIIISTTKFKLSLLTFGSLVIWNGYYIILAKLHPHCETLPQRIYGTYHQHWHYFARVHPTASHTFFHVYKVFKAPTRLRHSSSSGRCSLTITSAGSQTEKF